MSHSDKQEDENAIISLLTSLLRWLFSKEQPRQVNPAARMPRCRMPLLVVVSHPVDQWRYL